MTVQDLIDELTALPSSMKTREVRVLSGIEAWPVSRVEGNVAGANELCIISEELQEAIDPEDY